MIKIEKSNFYYDTGEKVFIKVTDAMDSIRWYYAEVSPTTGKIKEKSSFTEGSTRHSCLQLVGADKGYPIYKTYPEVLI